jgi:hypothetical protein
VGNMGWTFVGEVSSQRLRARTAGLAAGISVLFGLTFNTSVPVMRMSTFELKSKRQKLNKCSGCEWG